MLTDADCRNATCPPELKRRRLTHGGGLYLEVSPSSSKRWFWKFYPDGKESRLALGAYPAVTLKAARAARDEARKVRQTGTNLVQQRKAERLIRAGSKDSSFEAVAREFHGVKKAEWSESHAKQWLRCCEKDLFPRVGSLALLDVTAPLLLATLRKIEARGALQIARDLREFAGQVFRYGIATGKCTSNPAADLRSALKAHVVRHAPAVLEPMAVGELLRGMNGYAGQPTTRAALLLSARSSSGQETCGRWEWAEIDTDAALWTIPAAKMKRCKHQKLNGRPHLVPLAPQALAILEELKPLSGHRRYVFPSLLSGERPMSNNTFRTALRRMGYDSDEMTAQGFRAMARTLMAERLPGIAEDVVEAQLAHGKSGPLGMAYDRAEYLDRLRDGAQVIEFKAA